VTDFLIVWTPASVLTALIGGGALGLLIVSRFENPRFDALETVAVMVIIGMLAGLVFFAGQAVETYYSDGPAFAWRVISRFGLWGLFVVAMAFGTGLGVRFRRGTWR
jgi:hypothetical protein